MMCELCGLQVKEIPIWKSKECKQGGKEGHQFVQTKKVSSSWELSCGKCDNKLFKAIWNTEKEYLFVKCSKCGATITDLKELKEVGCE